MVCSFTFGIHQTFFFDINSLSDTLGAVGTRRGFSPLEGSRYAEFSILYNYSPLKYHSKSSVSLIASSFINVQMSLILLKPFKWLEYTTFIKPQSICLGV